MNRSRRKKEEEKHNKENNTSPTILAKLPQPLYTRKKVPKIEKRQINSPSELPTVGEERKARATILSAFLNSWNVAFVTSATAGRDCLKDN